MFKEWMVHNGLNISRDVQSDAYRFVASDMRIDADGAPNAYHPDPNRGLDDNRNAGYGHPRKRWWKNVLVPNPADPDNAYVQPSGEYAGYFVSQTALQDPDFPVTDPNRYVDAVRVPYIVFPASFAGLSGTGRLGDFGYAIHRTSGLSSPFIVGDIGPSDEPLGEVSIALATALGGVDVNPRTGAGKPSGEVVYVVFRFSSADAPSKRWRLEQDAVHTAVEENLSRIGGRAACLAGL